MITGMKSIEQLRSAPRVIWLISGIVAFVVVLLAVMLLIQNKYSHPLQQLTIRLDIPSEQDGLTRGLEVAISEDMCQIVNFGPDKEEKQDCPINQSGFHKVQKLFNEYGIIDKIIASDEEEHEALIGQRTTITATLGNGDTYTALMGPEDIENMGPFFEEVMLLVPSFEAIMSTQGTILGP